MRMKSASSCQGVASFSSISVARSLRSKLVPATCCGCHGARHIGSRFVKIAASALSAGFRTRPDGRRITAPPRVHLLDVEGTVAPISLVSEQLFPYARARFGDFLKKQIDEPGVRA